MKKKTENESKGDSERCIINFKIKYKTIDSYNDWCIISKHHFLIEVLQSELFVCDWLNLILIFLSLLAQVVNSLQIYFLEHSETVTVGRLVVREVGVDLKGVLFNNFILLSCFKWSWPTFSSIPLYLIGQTLASNCFAICSFPCPRSAP